MPPPGSNSHHAGAVKLKGKDDGCCGIFFLKYVLYIFNFIFWLSGGAILAVGIWTLLDKHTYVSLLASSTYVATTYILIATGGFILIVGFLGCCGASRENRACLMTYGALLLLIFLMEAISGVLAHMYESTIHDELERNLNVTMLHNYKLDDEKTDAIDQMQRTFKCCGAKDFRDWQYSRWKKGNPSLDASAPDSCCISPESSCAIRDHPSNIYYEGCVLALEHYLKRHLIIIGAVGLGLCCLQIFGIVFACCLARKVKEWNDRQKSYW